jgi:hypothetical protein
MDINFFVLLQKLPAETLPMLQQAYGDGELKIFQIHEKHVLLNDGSESVDDPRYGRHQLEKNKANVECARDAGRSV